MGTDSGTTRRDILAGAAALAAIPVVGSQQSAATYLVLTLSDKGLPVSALASCAELEKTVQFFADEAKRAKTKPDEVGAEFIKRATAKRTELQAAIASAKTAHANAKVDETFVYVNTGLALGLTGLGLVCTGPVAVGVLAAAGVLSGPASFTTQVYFRKGQADADFVMGYAQGRSMMYVELATNEAATVGGKLVGSAVTAAGYFTAAFEYSTALNDQKSALALLKRVTSELELVDKGLQQMGTDKKAWAALYEKMSTAANAALKLYISSHKDTDCRLLLTPPPKGPILYKS